MISIIVATSKNGVIGKNGEIPWYLPDDLKHFAKITREHTVVMGRKTYESIVKRLGSPLPDRENIIVTTQEDYKAPGCTVVKSIDDVIKKFSTNSEEIFVIGGGEIYKQFLQFANKLYITEVKIDCIGDISFPQYNKNEWKETTSAHHYRDEKHLYEFTFLEFVRK
ncbi:MAG: dihydrofolate reductase [Candidatus Paceibacterota bacterium]